MRAIFYPTCNAGCMHKSLGERSEPPHWAVQSRFRVIYMYVGLSMGNPYKNYVCQNAWPELRGPNTRMLKVSFGWLKPTYDTRIIHFYCILEQL